MKNIVTGNIFFSAFFLAAAFILTSCANQPEEAAGIQLYGMIYDDFNQPVGGAEITLNESLSQLSDSEGRFVFPSIEPGDYSAMVTKNGFENNQIEFILSETGQVLYIKLVSVLSLKEQIEKAMAVNDYSKALALIKRALKTEPDNPVVLFQSAIVYYKQKSLEKSLETCYRLLDLDYDYKEIFDLMFLIYKKHPDPDKEELLKKRYEDIKQ